MAEIEQSKVCPLCAETIKAVAKVCPFCRRAQGRLFFISRFDLSAIMATVLFSATGIASVYYFWSARPYSPNKDKITVLTTRFGVEATTEHTNVVVSGILTNESAYSWTLTQFEIRFYGADGKTVDAETAGSEMALPPHSESSFHLSLYRRRSIPEHASSKVTITEAKEVGFWINSD